MDGVCAAVYYLCVMVIFCIVFSATFQSGSSIELFVENDVLRHFAWATVPTTAYIALYSLFVILLGPLLLCVGNGKRLALRSSLLSGLLFGVVGFLVFALAAWVTTGHNLMPSIWIVVAFFFWTWRDINYAECFGDDV